MMMLCVLHARKFDAKPVITRLVRNAMRDKGPIGSVCTNTFEVIKERRIQGHFVAMATAARRERWPV